MGKTAPKQSKYAIFQNWLDTRTKMEMHDPNVHPIILGGVKWGFWSLFLDLGAQSAIFWHLKTGTFALLECQKMALWAPKSSNGLQKPRETPPKMMRFHFRASIKPIFENHFFRAVSGPFHPLYETKISNRSPSVVYGSITLKFFRGLWEPFCTSGSTDETKFKKSVFFGTPYCWWLYYNIISTCMLSLRKKDKRKTNKFW